MRVSSRRTLSHRKAVSFAACGRISKRRQTGWPNQSREKGWPLPDAGCGSPHGVQVLVDRLAVGVAPDGCDIAVRSDQHPTW
jgi:hypothetical protein